MHLEWPAALVLLIPALFWWRARRKQQGPAVNFSSLELVQYDFLSWRVRWSWLPDALRTAAVLILILGLSRPRLEISAREESTLGVAIELLVDISSSMDMTLDGGNQKMTRLEAVKEVLQKFVLGDAERLGGRAGDLLGLIVFARYADTMSPLTSAHDALAEIIKTLTIEDRPNEDGTAYGDAVALAAARLQHLDRDANRPTEKPVKSRVMVLLTDGENNCGRHLPLEATALAKEWGIRIYVISLAEGMGGTGSSTERLLSDGPTEAEQILQRMAGETGGLYRRATDLDSLQAVYNEIDSLEKSEIRAAYHQEWRELHPACSGLGLLLLCLEVAGRTSVFRRIP